MMIWFVVLYLAVTIAIGLVAATRVHTTKDYVVAGRSLPLFVVIATVFATWFGSETVLGIPARFATDGLGGIVEDPFGASMCLVLVGLFFARKLYRMNLLTIGDFYRQRYNPTVEFLTSLAIIASYLGWVSAQIVAMGLVFNVLAPEVVPLSTGILIGAAVVLVYTLWGGMFSVAWTNAFQMVVIVLGLLYLAWLLGDKAGGVSTVVAHAAANDKLHFWPALTARDILAFIGAAVTMMLGSIPQQDVFQRVTSAKTEDIAMKGAVIGGVSYFLFAFVPIFLVYSATLIDPALFAEHLDSDPQHILPSLILSHTPLFAQIIFFGALLSAIMSTASGTLLAPSVTFTENILKGTLGVDLSDQHFLWATRVSVVVFTAVVTLFALNSDSSIYEMVGNAYKVTLVAAFVPLIFGLYWSRANTQGALFASVGGFLTWILIELLIGSDSFVPPQLAGLAVSLAGMVIGSLLPQWIGKPKQRPHVRGHAAGHTHHVSSGRR